MQNYVQGCFPIGREGIRRSVCTEVWNDQGQKLSNCAVAAHDKRDFIQISTKIFSVKNTGDIAQ